MSDASLSSTGFSVGHLLRAHPVEILRSRLEEVDPELYSLEKYCPLAYVDAIHAELDVDLFANPYRPISDDVRRRAHRSADVETESVRGRASGAIGAAIGAANGIGKWLDYGAPEGVSAGGFETTLVAALCELGEVVDRCEARRGGLLYHERRMAQDWCDAVNAVVPLVERLDRWATTELDESAIEDRIRYAKWIQTQLARHEAERDDPLRPEHALPVGPENLPIYEGHASVDAWLEYAVGYSGINSLLVHICCGPWPEAERPVAPIYYGDRTRQFVDAVVGDPAQQKTDSDSATVGQATTVAECARAFNKTPRAIREIIKKEKGALGPLPGWETGGRWNLDRDKMRKWGIDRWKIDLDKALIEAAPKSAHTKRDEARRSAT